VLQIRMCGTEIIKYVLTELFEMKITSYMYYFEIRIQEHKIMVA